MFNKETILQDTTNLIKELCDLLQSLCPIETLKLAYWEFISLHLGKNTESEMGTEENDSNFLIEYLQSLFISIELNTKLRSPNDIEWNELKKKITQIRKNCIFYFPIVNKKEQETKSKLIQEKNFRLAYKLLFSQHIRGKRYGVHEREHLNSLLKPHDEILKKLYGITAQDISDGINELFFTFSFSPKYIEEYNQVENISYSFYKKLQKQDLSKEEIKKQLRNKMKHLKLEDKIYDLQGKLFKEDLFDVEKITGWPKGFVKKFSSSIGSNKNFLTDGKYPGTPLQVLPVMKKPFLEYNSHFYLFSPYILQDHLYRNIQSAVLEDNSYYSDKWNRIQKTVSEKLPFEILEKIIGNHEQIINFKYKIKDDNKSESWFECDGIILFEGWLFVIEVKSGKTSHISPAQNINYHLKTIEKLLTEPAKQGRRFIEALKKNGSLDLYDENKKITKTISINNFKQSIIIAVSLEQLTDISPQIQQFKELGLSSEGESVLCISIDDLRVYRDFFNGAIEFCHYLLERSKAFYNSQLTLDDELDHIGLYLKYNQYHDITNNLQNKSQVNIFCGYRDEIDRYFLYKPFLDLEKNIKPKQNMPFFLTAIIKNLELNRKPGFTKVGVAIYSLADEARNKLNQDILNIISLQHKEKRIRPSVFSLCEFSGSLIIRMPDVQPDFRPIDYAIKNMFIQEKEEVLLLDISVDERDKITKVSFEWIEKNNLSKEEVQEYKEEAKKFAEFRFFNQMKFREKKKIGRNEQCPCGSRKKYKKCHGII